MEKASESSIREKLKSLFQPSFPSATVYLFVELASSKAAVEVYYLIVRRGPLSSRELIRETMLPEPTIHNALNKLEEMGLIEEKGKRQLSRRGGKKAILWGAV